MKPKYKILIDDIQDMIGERGKVISGKSIPRLEFNTKKKLLYILKFSKVDFFIFRKGVWSSKGLYKIYDYETCLEYMKTRGWNVLRQ